MLKVLKFSGKNLLEKKLSSFLLVLFLVFGFCLLLFLEIGKSYLLDITNTIYSGKINENKLIIEKESSSLSSLFGKIAKIKPGFNEGDIKQIKSIYEVKNIFKSSTFENSAIMSIDMLGTSFTTDVFFEGIDENMLNSEFQNFDSNNDYVPLLVSEKIIDSLIKIFIKNNNVKLVTKELILGKEFDITFGKSSLTKNSNKHISKKGKIVGFGEGSNFMFISIPLKTLENINKSLYIEETNINKLFLEPKKGSDYDSLQIEIEEIGFYVTNPEVEKEKMKNLISIFYKIGLSIVSIIIILISYSLVSFIILRIVESKKDNSIMFIMGVDKKTISKIYIFESFIISLLGLLLSLPLIYFFIKIVNTIINDYNLSHNFIQLPYIELGYKNFVSLLIFFLFINIVSISFSVYRIWRSEWR